MQKIEVTRTLVDAWRFVFRDLGLLCKTASVPFILYCGVSFATERYYNAALTTSAESQEFSFSAVILYIIAIVLIDILILPFMISWHRITILDEKKPSILIYLYNRNIYKKYLSSKLRI